MGTPQSPVVRIFSAARGAGANILRCDTFPEKKPYYEESEILITQDLLAYDEWDEASIDARQAQLSERATQIWVLPCVDENEK